MSSFPESQLAVGMNLDVACSTTEVLIHVVGSSEVQCMQADKMVPKKAVWDHVAAEMKRIGFDMGENGGARCRQKWKKTVRNYHHFVRTRTFNMKAHYPLYYDRLEEILNRKKQAFNNIGAGEGEPLVNACGITGLKRKQDDKCSDDVDGQSSSSPKRSCHTIDSSYLSSSDVPISSASSGGDDESEVSKILPENCTFNSSISDNNHASKSTSKETNGEEFILVYPGGTKYSVGSKFIHESDMHAGYLDSEVLVTVYPDVSKDFTHKSVPKHFMDHSYTEEIFTECHKQSSHFSVPEKSRNLANINPSLFDLPKSIQKSSSVTKKSTGSTPGLSTIIVSPKPNQPARPIPTAGEAMMSLVMRLYEDDRRREKARARRTEARIQHLEILLERQAVRQQELLNKALLTLGELDQTTKPLSLS
jgi:hypothetical protein